MLKDSDNYTVYMHVNKINNKKYIGLTMQPLNHRYGKNGNNYRTCPYFWHAIQKYGWDNFDHIIIAEHLTKDEACEIEKQKISEYNTIDKQYGYNVSKGGEHLDHNCIEEIWNRPGYRDRISEIRKNLITQEQREYMSKTVSDLWNNKDYRDRCTAAIKKANSKPVRIIETGQICESVREASNVLGLNHSLVSRAIRKGWRAKGFHVEYINKEDISLNAERLSARSRTK